LYSEPTLPLILLAPSISFDCKQDVVAEEESLFLI